MTGGRGSEAKTALAAALRSSFIVPAETDLALEIHLRLFAERADDALDASALVRVATDLQRARKQGLPPV